MDGHSREDAETAEVLSKLPKRNEGGRIMCGNILNQTDWSGYFRTWSEQLRHCDSEEDIYRKLKKFKEEFNSAYGRLSRSKRRKNGFRYKDGE